MVSQKIKDMYFISAKSLADAKQALGDAIANDLTFGGSNVPYFLEETKAVNNAIGCIMGLLARNGEKVEPVEGQDGFVYMLINNCKLVCSTEQLIGKNASVKVETARTLVETKEPTMTPTPSITNTPESIPNNSVPLQIETAPEPVTSAHRAPNIANNMPVESVKAQDIQSDIAAPLVGNELENEFLDESTDTTFSEPTDNPEQLFADSNNETHVPAFQQAESQPEIALSQNTIPVAEEPKKGARFIMPNIGEPNTNVISGLADIFQDEKSKPISEFVFENYRITVSHMGIGKGEDMTIMIAPLKISKYAEANAPIVVYVYYKGRSYIRSSYDALDDGKNIVTMQIGDYELLFRGSFDGNGMFQSMISTTGISANQGDRIVVINKQSHCPVGKQVKNGHLKFRYVSHDNGSDVQGTMEIFPVSEDEDEYVAIAVHGEWRDPSFISSRPGGLPEVRLRTEGGIPAALLCTRNGDIVEADIVFR